MFWRDSQSSDGCLRPAAGLAAALEGKWPWRSRQGRAAGLPDLSSLATERQLFFFLSEVKSERDTSNEAPFHLANQMPHLGPRCALLAVSARVCPSLLHTQPIRSMSTSINGTEATNCVCVRYTCRCLMQRQALCGNSLTPASSAAYTPESSSSS